MQLYGFTDLRGKPAAACLASRTTTAPVYSRPHMPQQVRPVRAAHQIARLAAHLEASQVRKANVLVVVVLLLLKLMGF